MKRLLALSIIMFLSALKCSYATTITFSAAGARQVLDASGGNTLNGDLVWVGTLADESFTFNPALSIAANIIAIAGTPGSVNTATGGTTGATDRWKEFTLDTSSGTANSGVSNGVTIGGLGGGGKLTLSDTDNNFGATKADFFNGKLLYVWVFNAATTGAATQMGIFRAGTYGTGATHWNFPNNGDTNTNPATLTTDTTNEPTMVAVGGAGTVLSSGAGNMELVAPTPEPSTLAALIGGAGLLAMIRRRVAK